MSLRKAVPSLFLLVFSIALLPFQAYADEASRRVKVEELFKLTHLEQTYGQIMTQVMAQTEQMTKQMFPEGNISDAQKKAACRLSNAKQRAGEGLLLLGSHEA